MHPEVVYAAAGSSLRTQWSFIHPVLVYVARYCLCTSYGPVVNTVIHPMVVYVT